MLTPAEIDVEAAIERQKPNWFQAAVVFWSCLIMFVEGYDAQVVAYAAPAIVKAWHIDKTFFGPVFSASLFGYMVGATLLTNLSDRFGRKAVIVSGNVLFGLLTLATARATSIEDLLILRFIAGLGLGCSIPAAIALGAEYAPARSRSMRISLMFVGYTMGAALGGVLAAWLMVAFGWQSVFYLGGFASLALSLILVFVLPESVRFLALKQTSPGQIASILAKLRPDLKFPPNARFVLREEAQAGLPLKYLFTQGRAVVTLLLWLSFIMSLTAHHFLTSWLPTVLASDGVPLAHAVVAGALIQGGGGIGSVLIGWFLDKRGIISIVLAFILAAPLVALIGSGGMPEVLLMVVVFLSGLFLIGGQIGLNALSGTIYPTYIRSTGAGWAFGIGRVGSIIGPLVGTVLISRGLSASALFICAAVPVVCCAAAVFLLRAATAAAAPTATAAVSPEPRPEARRAAGVRA